MKKFITKIFKAENRKLKQLSYVFCTDQELIKINRKFLDHDFYTDIVTFDLSSGKEIEGEVYISIDRVRENAAAFNVRFSEELRRVMFHGVLHLCGYKDKTNGQKKLIRQKEDFYISKFRLFHVKRS